ncbi:hypothetical protein CAC42_7947 [Sphaceloma murrayae]|uniref:Uncharacterized protein n=1 Tax=Sphaceloma murrayae TaxID=2082308 RepID=A0A2K1QYA9_9PEZI|nr:hypothetical protein CAC42_7947 [Sphaceloma murrayae]
MAIATDAADRIVAVEAVRCREAFLAPLQTSSNELSEWTENTLADFNEWSASVGVLSRSSVSLDKRLENNQEARAVFIGLLVNLRHSLEAIHVRNHVAASTFTAIPGTGCDEGETLGELSPSLDRREMATVTHWDLATICSGKLAVAAITVSTARETTNIVNDKDLNAGRAFCLTRLAVALTKIHYLLQAPPDHLKAELVRRLPDLLDRLNYICTLHLRKSERLDPQYNALCLLCVEDLFLQTRPGKPLTIALKLFARNEKLANVIITCFDSLVSEPSRQQTSEATGRVAHGAPSCPGSEAFPWEMNDRLYEAICKESIWQSCQAREDHIHNARLRLREHCAEVDGAVTFDSAFSVPGVEPSSGMRWQQIRFLLNRPRGDKTTARVGRKVLFSGVPEDSSAQVSPSKSNTDDASYRLLDEDRFCDLICKDIGLGRFCLKLERNRLWQRTRIDGNIDQDISNSPSLSLRELASSSQRSTHRLALAYVLTRSIWQFYTSKWMDAWWSADRIHFMREKARFGEADSNEKINYSIPYLEFHDTRLAQYGAEESFDHIPHRYPRVLSLGVLLLQVCSQTPIDFDCGNCNTTEAMLNTFAWRGKQIVNDPGWPGLDFKNADIIERLKAVVRTCFEPETFEKPLRGQGETVVIDAEMRREILYHKVVWPLRCLLSDIGLLNEEGRFQDISSHRSALERDAVGENNGADDMVDKIDKKGLPALQWLNDACSTVTAQRLFRAYKDPSLKRIRIAVLDTGCDLTSAFFTPQRRARLKSWYDLVDTSTQSFVDGDGHGTHVVSLAMRMAQTADIYVARVAGKTEDLEAASGKVAEAIQWAGKHEVDIVVMSFGYPEPIPAIRRAIGSSRMLFFAAAANEGGNQTEMFPASYLNKVIPIRATDQTGDVWRFNPPVNPKRWVNFMTLGTDVPAAWPGTNELKCQTGTSIATPIAAGIAATILADARLMLKARGIEGKLTEQDEEQIQLLWTIEGMEAVLHQMSQQRKYSNKRCYLFPQGDIPFTEEERWNMYKTATKNL